MTGIAVELMPDAGAPQVGVTVDGLGTGTSVITVEVSWDDAFTWHAIRGGQLLTVVGGSTFIRDHVPPLNVAATYRLTVVSGATIPATLEAAITVTSATAWIQDPLVPRGAVSIHADMNGGNLLLSQGSLAGATWAQTVDYALPEGATLPVASIGQRLLASEVPLSVTYEVAAEAGALRRMLLTSGSLVLRGLTAPDLLDAVAHVAVGTAAERRDGDQAQITTWDLVARQVRPTSMRIIVPWWTYDQVKALWSGQTYDAVKASRPGDTYLDWLRSPEVP